MNRSVKLSCFKNLITVAKALVKQQNHGMLMMKLNMPIALVLSLVACSPSAPATVEVEAPKADPTQTAVTAYLKKTLDDPASYQPAHWGKPDVWQQQDANAMRADSMQDKVDLSMHYLKLENARATRLADLHLTRAQKSTFDKGFKDAAADVEFFQNLQDSLLKANDSTRLGTIVSHAYRAKNKMGALQLDSARFLVYKSGQVQRL